MVAGTHAMNKALSLVRGDFVTHLDDDDEYVPGRIEKLVAFALDRTAELVWHPFWYEDAAGAWKIKKAPRFTFGQITTSSVFYCRALACIAWDLDAWRLREPGDWNRFRKMRYLRPVMRRFPEPLLRHYREGNAPASG
jgi:glycosyltransferase involved in cell wall biosynthesis